jgi:hypothetical protein
MAKIKTKLKTEAASTPSGGSAAPSPTREQQNRDWLRLVVMVENTEANRKIAGLLIADGRQLADRFEGKKIVKAEALQVFGMITAKEKPPEATAQPNVAPSHAEKNL